MDLNKTNQERYETGLETLRKMVTEKEVSLIEKIGDFFPDFSHTLVSFGFGDLYAREELSLRDREIITLTSLITQGAIEQLGFHVKAALRVGMTSTEILELVLQCAGYAGFPRAVSALHVVEQVFKEEGIQVNGKEGSSKEGNKE
ncbi:carboxymuconolactone decarboxylase family protein [Marinicrinis sediminis]|uniref:Carboxymuconolactone decarboxylase family protein n=1 Tax=Marinicrinis sediminis TaxID=1652465 RepID=A0ABW5RER5_9BACL